MHLGKKYIVRKSHSKELSQRKTSHRVVILEAGIKKYWIELQNVSLCTLFCIEFKETNLLKWIKVGLRCSLNLLWHRKCHCKVQKIYWSMPFYKFGCSYVMLYNIQNAYLFCLFCDYWFEIINYITCNIKFYEGFFINQSLNYCNNGCFKYKGVKYRFSKSQ